MNPSAKIEKIGYPEEFTRQGFEGLTLIEKLLHLYRQLGQLPRVGQTFLTRERAAQLAEIQTQEVKRNHLRGKSLG